MAISGGRYLTRAENEALRTQGLLHDQEVAVELGDRLVAENLLTGGHRLLDARSPVTETTKKGVLLG